MKEIKRVVSTRFWDDEKVIETFSPEDRYFMLYLMTNQYTTQLGIYRLPIKKAAVELGYSTETVIVLLDRFDTKYNIIKYSKKTREVAIKNYLRYSIVKGGKPVFDCLKKDEDGVIDKELVIYVYNSMINRIDQQNINITVKQFLDYIKDKYSINDNDNGNDNDNDNDNERYVDESYHESYHDSLETKMATKYQQPSENEINAFFDKIWAEYPIKRGKGSVSKTKKKALYKIGFDELKRCIDRYLSEVKDMRFCKNGSTFFNSGYVDFLDENYDGVNRRESDGVDLLDMINRGVFDE